MKRLFLLATAVSLLFLTGCQKNEGVEPQNDQVAGSGQGMFNMVGDQRNPGEFMSAEEVARIQSIFDKNEGKTLKNPVVQEGVETRSDVLGNGQGMYILEEAGIPIVKIDGKYLYIKVRITYGDLFVNHGIEVEYCLGAFDGTYTPSYSIRSTVIYYYGTQWLFPIPNCRLTVALPSNMLNKSATVTFPAEMLWDKGSAGFGTCEVQLNPQLVKVSYAPVISDIKPYE